MMKSKKHFGFTAIELIIVLMIVGILATVTIPVISQFLPGIRLTGTTRSLTADLRVAQEKAVTSQNQNLIRFFPNVLPPKYQLIEITNAVESIIREEILPSDEIMAIDASISNNQIIFSPDGGPSSSGNITLSLAGKTKIISVSPAGFIKINN